MVCRLFFVRVAWAQTGWLKFATRLAARRARGAEQIHLSSKRHHQIFKKSKLLVYFLHPFAVGFHKRMIQSIHQGVFLYIIETTGNASLFYIQ